ncbi:major facilitator superfamily domain-containing protein [Boletus edulis]|nr:major facilitator superfamily domain-containing protein [Boletus edulis]
MPSISSSPSVDTLTGSFLDKEDKINTTVFPVRCANEVEELSPAERARLLRKLDWHLLPPVSLLYLLCFLDRANVGNAKVAGMSADLHLVGLRYNIAAAVFFVFYSLWEVPSNIILKLFRPSRWIPTIMLSWGLVMTFMCFVNTYQGLIIARMFLGLTEAGLFPGVNYYLARWYPRSDRGLRVALFFSAATLAGAFGGLLAYCIEEMEGIGGLHGWQWIFCLEGLATTIIAFGAFFFMHDYPETASFLTATERYNITELLKQDSQSLATHYDFQFVLQALKDYKSYIQMGIFTGLLLTVYAIALFTPTIIDELGFSAANAQLLSVPPFVVGCVSTILVGVASDKLKIRGPFVIGGAFVSLIGYIILYTQTSPGASYVGIIFAVAGVYPTIAVTITWAASNAGGDLKRGIVIAMVNGFGNLGGIGSSFVYRDPPRFHIGHGTIMSWLSFSMLLSMFAMWNYNRINKQKEEQCRRDDITQDRMHEFQNMGDQSPLFRYTL